MVPFAEHGHRNRESIEERSIEPDENQVRVGDSDDVIPVLEDQLALAAVSVNLRPERLCKRRGRVKGAVGGVFEPADRDELASPPELCCACTVNEIVPLPVRLCASDTVTGRDFAPAGVAEVTVTEREKTLSPAVASPFVPLSNSCVSPAIPMSLVVTVTPRPVLVGFAPGVTVAVSNVVPPARTVFGDAPPVTVGFVGVGAPEVGQTNALTRSARVVVHGAIAPPIAMPWRVHAWALVSPTTGAPMRLRYPSGW